MSIEDKLINDMKTAMKSGDRIKLETIRMLRAQLKNASLGKKEPLPESDVFAIISKEAKRRKESIELYRKGGREDLVENESKELEILQAYLPEALSDAEIDTLIDQAIAQVNAADMQDMGKVMGVVMPQIKGRADGNVVQTRVRQKLS
ncbi:GatB/YqeY domain-containing protein [bacterium]|nr:GatB/YqeY domain-containing protein [bacterium]